MNALGAVATSVSEWSGGVGRNCIPPAGVERGLTLHDDRTDEGTD